MNRARGRALLLATGCTLTALTMTGCAAFSDATPARAPDGRVRVVTSFYPLQYVAERVAGDRARVENLTTPGKEPHDLELSPQQTGELAVADLVVYEQGLQASVDDAVQQNASGRIVEAAGVAGLQPMDQVDGGDPDPHFWQDPLKLADVVDAVADEMEAIDPTHAASYADNAVHARADLEQLDREYAAGLDSCERDTVVVSHDAFGYLGRYGLRLEPIVGLSPDAEPTPADLGRLQQLIADQHITTVFGERLVSPALSQTLAGDMGVRAAVLDPIEGLTDQTSGEDYLSLMRANLAALEKANGC